MLACSRILFGFKKEGDSDLCYNIDALCRHCEVSNSDTKGHMVCDSGDVKYRSQSHSQSQTVERRLPGCGGDARGTSMERVQRFSAGR